MPEIASDTARRVGEIVEGHMGLEGPLLPILHAVQAEFGHLPDAALPVIAEGLNLTRAEVHGVASFYHDFRHVPAGTRVLKVCRAEACQAVGSNALVADLEARLGVRMGETSADGAVTLEPVYCLGLCACGPAALLDGEVIGRASGETLEKAVRS
jgi:formate dehydrogenase subunit gamma